MTDAQIIAVAITVLAVLVGTMFNNSRIGDLNGRISDVKEVLRAEARGDKVEILGVIADLRRVIESNHETTLRMLADIDLRVTRLEARH